MVRILPVKSALLLCLCFVLHISAENKQVVTEMLVTNNDTIYKYSYIYNNEAQPVVETKTIKNGTSWENVSQTEWFRQTETPSQVERVWTNNKWNDSYRIRNEIVGSKIVETHSIFSNSVESDIRMIESDYFNNSKTTQIDYNRKNGNWEKTLDTRFFYSSTNLTDSTIINQFNNNELIFSYKSSYNYNSDTSLKSVIFQTKSSIDLSYSNISKSIYNYTANLISSLRNYRWNKKTSNWENDTKLDYIRDNIGNISDEISWQWNSMFWEQVLRYDYQYDAENHIFKKNVSLPIYRDWRNTNSVNYLREPNSRNMTIESVYGFWGGKAGDKVNTHISFPFNDETIIRKAETIQLTYAPFVQSSINNPSTNPSFIKTYPNPSHGIFYISNFDAAKSSWILTSLNGSVLRNSELNLSSSVIDITDLPNGIYLLNIRSSSGNGTHKIVKY